MRAQVEHAPDCPGCRRSDVPPGSPEATGTYTLMETASGLFVNLAEPSADKITLPDIARGLARARRFRGHSFTSYTVAEHACLVAQKLHALGAGPVLCLAGLHHDDPEAYLGDLPTPLKRHPVLGPIWRELEAQYDVAIIDALGLPLRADVYHGGIVKDVDSWALVYEARRLLRSGGRGWGVKPRWDVDREFVPWSGSLSEEAAESMWLELHELLMDRCLGSVV